ALVDTIGSAALVTKTPYSHVSLAINVNYMNPAKAGRTVRCEGVVSKFGRTVANMTISLYDAADDALLAEGTHIKFIQQDFNLMEHIHKDNAKRPHMKSKL
ncbi:hypothetical protein H632_c1523p0, partial [Helicosporidium sp. ATCC 50920]